ncbi:hypothetical protein P6U15_18885 [Bacillus paranthracis]|uniref:hypothetical protein n=1 Tax=Bacillus paranthracis TaxID=2026186 RepID=UPI002407A979|nr:hypothetical protein [Bacillus paranthracis]MDG0880147.1 hypothetical protein [Bacillus paranthracis]
MRNDISSRKEAEQRLRLSESRYRELAYHDALTSLPNRFAGGVLGGLTAGALTGAAGGGYYPAPYPVTYPAPYPVLYPTPYPGYQQTTYPY